MSKSICVKVDLLEKALAKAKPLEKTYSFIPYALGVANLGTYITGNEQMSFTHFQAAWKLARKMAELHGLTNLRIGRSGRDQIPLPQTGGGWRTYTSRGNIVFLGDKSETKDEMKQRIHKKLCRYADQLNSIALEKQANV